MTSPIIDERALLDILDCTPTYEMVQRLQQGALFALVDCYDRDITRGAFIEAATITANLIDALGRLALLHNIEQFAAHHDGAAALSDITEAQAGVKAMVEECTQKTVKMVELMRQCPLDEDRIH